MRQRISAEDLKQLSLSQQEKLRNWWKSQEGDWVLKYEEEFLLANDNTPIFKPHCLPLLSIGQCIEFLDSIELLDVQILEKELTSEWEVNVLTPECNEWKFVKHELIDALWKAVKGIL